MRIYFPLTIVTLMVSVCLLGGCKQMQSQFGNFAGPEATELVQDSLSILKRMYLPAKTRFYLVETDGDDFGLTLSDGLRAEGYGVGQHSGEEDDRTLNGLSLSYIVDRPSEMEIRVTLLLQGQVLSRLYEVQRIGDSVTHLPRGPWSFRQKGEKV